MRRLLIYLFCLFPLFLTAANMFSLSTVSGHPGDTLIVTASLTNTDVVVALQVDIPLSRHVRYLDASTILSSSRIDGQSLVATAVNDTLHISIFSLSNKPIKGSSGELFSFSVILGTEPTTYNLIPQVILANGRAQSLSVTTSPGSVILLSPKIQVITTLLDFGHIPIRSTYSQRLVVQNTGNEPLRISDIIFSSNDFSVTGSAYTLAAGASRSITIKYTPLLHGDVIETIRLRSNAVNDADAYGANLATIVADPYSVNELHLQSASGVSDDTVTITVSMNNMETDLVGVQMSLLLPEQLEYVKGSLAPLSRAQNLNAASATSGDTLVLMLYSISNSIISGTDGNLFTFRLRLNGITGTYDLSPLNAIIANTFGENMVSAVYSSSVTIQSPTITGETSLDFGIFPISRRDTVSYSIRNIGDAPLIVEKVFFLMEGFRIITPLPIIINRNRTQTIQVEYASTSGGSISTRMLIYSNDPNCRMKSVDLTAQPFEPNTVSLLGEQQANCDYVLTVNLTNYSPIAGLQFDITCPEGFIPQPFHLSNRLNGFSVTTQPIGNNKWRVVAFSFTNKEIPRGLGAIGSFRFLAKNVPGHSGKYVSISEIIVSDRHGENRFTGEDSQWLISTIHLVQFQDEDGSTLQGEFLEYGTMPVYKGPIPTKQQGERILFFGGWTPMISRVTHDATYIATYSEIEQKYVVSFSNKDSVIIQTDTLFIGMTPVFNGQDPTKDNTAHYSFVFKGWKPEISVAIEDVIYYPVFDSIVNKYMVTFCDEDGTSLQSDSVEYGVLPSYRGPVPNKKKTVKFTYVFRGWKPYLAEVTGNVTYVAVFDSIINKYAVAFHNSDHSLLQMDSLEYGAMPNYVGTIPIRESSAEYSYSFRGWTPILSPIAGNVTYTAQYDSIVNRYVVIFRDEDSTLLQIDTLLYGVLPEYRGTTPSKLATAQYSYHFAGWNNAITSVVGDAFYTATYTSVIKKYVVTFVDEGGEVLQRDTLDYGSTPVYRGEEPSKVGTAEYNYVFTGWNPAITEVTGDVTYMAMFDSIVNTYIITFINDDNSIFQIDTLEYGTMPVYRGAEPQKPSDGNYTYTFNGWQPEITSVVSDATYVATYEAIPISAIHDIPEGKNPVKIWQDGKMYILLPDGTRYDSTGKKVE